MSAGHNHSHPGACPTSHSISITAKAVKAKYIPVPLHMPRSEHSELL